MQYSKQREAQPAAREPYCWRFESQQPLEKPSADCLATAINSRQLGREIDADKCDNLAHGYIVWRMALPTSKAPGTVPSILFATERVYRDSNSSAASGQEQHPVVQEQR